MWVVALRTWALPPADAWGALTAAPGPCSTELLRARIATAASIADTAPLVSTAERLRNGEGKKGGWRVGEGRWWWGRGMRGQRGG